MLNYKVHFLVFLGLSNWGTGKGHYLVIYLKYGEQLTAESCSFDISAFKLQIKCDIFKFMWDKSCCKVDICGMQSKGSTHIVLVRFVQLSDQHLLSTKKNETQSRVPVLLKNSKFQVLLLSGNNCLIWIWILNFLWEMKFIFLITNIWVLGLIILWNCSLWDFQSISEIEISF